jgi:hypothetical protein
VTQAASGGATDTAGAARPLVSIRGVSKQFTNGTLAVHGVHLDLVEGEFPGAHFRVRMPMAAPADGVESAAS